MRDYRLTVEGELSDQVAAAFADMTLMRAGGYAILVGPVRDQAELQALLQRVSDLGLTLLSATAVGAPGWEFGFYASATRISTWTVSGLRSKRCLRLGCVQAHS